MKTFTLMDEVLASPTEPLPEVEISYRLRLAEHCLLMLVAGEGATVQHWERLANVTDFMGSLVVLGIADDRDGLVEDASAAMIEARDRARDQGAPIQLSGSAAGTVYALFEDYAECLRGISARTAIKAIRTTNARIVASRKARRRG